MIVLWDCISWNGYNFKNWASWFVTWRDKSLRPCTNYAQWCAAPCNTLGPGAHYCAFQQAWDGRKRTVSKREFSTMCVWTLHQLLLLGQPQKTQYYREKLLRNIHCGDMNITYCDLCWQISTIRGMSSFLAPCLDTSAAKSKLCKWALRVGTGQLETWQNTQGYSQGVSPLTPYHTHKHNGWLWLWRWVESTLSQMNWLRHPQQSGGYLPLSGTAVLPPQ